MSSEPAPPQPNKKLKPSVPDLDPDQRRVIEAAKSGKNVFFTGPAGSGKSYVIERIAGTDPSVSITALTGIAAVNVGGKTIHSFSGVGYARESKEELFNSLNDQAKERWRRCRVLIVDEVSMMSDDLFEKVEYVARQSRNGFVNDDYDEPFGKLQVIFCGDYYQLPPVSKDAEAKYCFESPLWKKMKFEHVFLRTNHRQIDPVLADGLAKMRVGVLEDSFLKKLMEPKPYPELIKPTRLVGTNAVVDKINEAELQKIMQKGTAVTFTAKEREYERDALKHVRGEKTLVLDVGAQVVHLTNLPPLYNGSRGVVTGFDDGLPIVQFASLPNPVVVPLYEFENRVRKRLLATRTCIPLRLAFALSIHKSQSMTIDLLDVDCKGMFAASQAYVALSRARTLEGLWVKNLDPGCVWCDPRVEAFYESFEINNDD